MVHSRLLNPLLHRLLLVNGITFYFKTTLKKFKEILSEVLNIFKYMIFQGRQNAFLWRFNQIFFRVTVFLYFVICVTGFLLRTYLYFCFMHFMVSIV